MVVVMPLYNLTGYSVTYSKASGSIWKYYRNEPALNNNVNIIDFPNGNNISTAENRTNRRQWNKRC